MSSNSHDSCARQNGNANRQHTAQICCQRRVKVRSTAVHCVVIPAQWRCRLRACSTTALLAAQLAAYTTWHNSAHQGDIVHCQHQVIVWIVRHCRRKTCCCSIRWQLITPVKSEVLKAGELLKYLWLGIRECRGWVLNPKGIGGIHNSSTQPLAVSQASQPSSAVLPTVQLFQTYNSSSVQLPAVQPLKPAAHSLLPLADATREP